MKTLEQQTAHAEHYYAGNWRTFGGPDLSAFIEAFRDAAGRGQKMVAFNFPKETTLEMLTGVILVAENFGYPTMRTMPSRTERNTRLCFVHYEVTA